MALGIAFPTAFPLLMAVGTDARAQPPATTLAVAHDASSGTGPTPSPAAATAAAQDVGGQVAATAQVATATASVGPNSAGSGPTPAPGMGVATAPTPIITAENTAIAQAETATAVAAAVGPHGGTVSRSTEATGAASAPDPSVFTQGDTIVAAGVAEAAVSAFGVTVGTTSTPDTATAVAAAGSIYQGQGVDVPAHTLYVEMPVPGFYDSKTPPTVQLEIQPFAPTYRVSWGDESLALGLVGFEVRVLSHEDYQTVLAVVPEWIELVFGPELNAAGNGSITMDMNSDFWLTVLPDGSPAEYLLDCENLWEVWQDGQWLFAFHGRVVKEQLLEDSGLQGVSVSGPGVAGIMDHGRVFPPGFPTPTAAQWVFNPVGGVDPIVTMAGAWLQLLEASASRGSLVSLVDPQFDAATDSNGVAWTDVAVRNQWIVDLNITLGEALDVARAADPRTQAAMRAEWYMGRDFALYMAATLGSDRSATVHFYDDNSTRTRSRTRSRENLANYVVVRDANGNFSLKEDAVSQGQWGHREFLDNRATLVLADTATRDSLAQVVLDQQKDERSEWVVQVEYGVKGREAFKDFHVGDWVGIQRYRPVRRDPLTGVISGGTSEIESYRVLAIVVQVSSDERVTMELTLQSKFDSKAVELSREITRILSQISQPTA